MKILYDATSISAHNSGVGYVAEHILKELVKQPSFTILAYTRKGVSSIRGIEDNKRLQIYEVGLPFSFFGIKRFAIEQTIVPYLIGKFKPDIVHYPAGFGIPFFFNRAQFPRILLTIHDLIPLTLHQEMLSPIDHWIYEASMRKSVQNAHTIVTVSEFTKKDVVKILHTDQKIQVIPNGIESPQHTDNTDGNWKHIKSKYKIPDQYILYLGGFSKRKNLPLLIRAFSHFSQKNNISLVLGGKYFDSPYLIKEVKKLKELTMQMGIEKKIIFLEFLNPEEKEALLSHAILSIYISLYEGFGLPVLESLLRGIPTITSRNSVMQEMCRQYAQYADANDENSVIKAMEDTLKDIDFWRTQAKQSSTYILEKFNWIKIGKAYTRLYQEIFDSNNS